MLSGKQERSKSMARSDEDAARDIVKIMRGRDVEVNQVAMRGWFFIGTYIRA